MKNLSGNNSKVHPFIVGTGGVAKGDLVTFSAGTVIKAVEAISTAIIVGIAEEAGAADAIVNVRLLESGDKVEVSYTGSTKTSLADTDLGTLFDLDDAQTIDLDDTTGGFMLLVGYNNDVDLAVCLIPKPLMYL